MRLIRNLILFCLIAIAACKKEKDVAVVTPIQPAGPVRSSSKSILSFQLKAADNSGLYNDAIGVINDDSIILTLPYGTDVHSLKPEIKHSGISISPDSGKAQDFTSPVTYTVTAENSTSKKYFAATRLVVGSTVYAGSTNGLLYAIDGKTGTLKWSYSTGGRILESATAWYNGMVYIGSADKYLYALDAKTGVLKWRYKTYGNAESAVPMVYNGVLYFGGTNSAYFYAIDATTGNLVWDKHATEYYLDPTVYKNVIYTACFGGLIAMDALTGKSLRNFSGSGISSGNPVVVNDVIYNGTENTVVSAYNINTGALIWGFSAGIEGSPSGPTLANGMVYNGGYNKYLYALDSATGAVKWSFAGDGVGSNGVYGRFYTPVVQNNVLYAGNNWGRFYAIDANTGKLKWKVSGVYNGTLANDRIYTCSSDKNLYALDAETGGVLWKYAAGGDVFSPPLIVTDDGIVYRPGVSGEHD